MKLSILKEVGRSIGYYDNQADEGEMNSAAVSAINRAVKALGDDLSRESIEAWIRMRYNEGLGFDRAVERVLDRESPDSEEEESGSERAEYDDRYARMQKTGSFGGDDEYGDIDLEREKREEDARDVEAEMRSARQELHGSDEECEQIEYEESGVPETEIGGHKIKLLVVGRDKNPFGNNPIGIIEFDGVNYHVYKQGMINIWAFKRRGDMSNEEGHEFDKWIDDNYDKAPTGDDN